MRLAEIAKKAKVSPATVSRVINTPDLVSPGRREQVQAVLKRLNYQPAPKAQRRGPKMRHGGVRRIAVWFVGAKRSPTLNWFQDQIAQIQSVHETNQIDLRVLFSDTAGELPTQLQRRELDGVIIQGQEPSPACLERLADLPHVWFMTRRTPGYPGDYVEPNNLENGRMAVDYLHRRGHKAVAVIATDPEYSAIRQRIEAFLGRARELGLQATAIHRAASGDVGYLNPSPLPEELEQLFARCRGLQPRPTGIFLPFDQFCGLFYRSMRQHGLEPGRDFDVILGNFTSVVYHNLDPLPAAIDINLQTLVRAVVDHLLWRIDHPKAPGRVGIAVSPTLVLPGSTQLSA